MVPIYCSADHHLSGVLCFAFLAFQWLDWFHFCTFEYRDRIVHSHPINHISQDWCLSMFGLLVFNGSP